MALATELFITEVGGTTALAAVEETGLSKAPETYCCCMLLLLPEAKTPILPQWSVGMQLMQRPPASYHMLAAAWHTRAG
jgi:hypothetical protein